MKDNEDYIYERIEGYLANKLSLQDKAAFDADLQKDAILAQKLKVHQLANEMVLENRLKAVNKSLLEHHASQGGGSSYWFLGSLLGLLAIGGAIAYYTIPDRSQAVPQNTESIQKGYKAITKEPESTQVTPSNKISNSGKSEIIKQPAEPAVPHKKGDVESASDGKQVQPPVGVTLQKPSSGTSQGTSHREPEAQASAKPQVEVPKYLHKDACEGVHIKFTVGQQPSCFNASTGKIWLREVSGGVAPYTLQIEDAQKQTHALDQLPAGVYEVTCLDTKGCKGSVKLSILQKICDKDYLFNPYSGEVLEMDAYTSNGILKIYDRQGNLYNTIQIQANTPPSWDGTSKSGELTEGFYNFIAEYADHAFAKGSITIVR